MKRNEDGCCVWANHFLSLQLMFDVRFTVASHHIACPLYIALVMIYQHLSVSLHLGIHRCCFAPASDENALSIHASNIISSSAPNYMLDRLTVFLTSAFVIVRWVSRVEGSSAWALSRCVSLLPSRPSAEHFLTPIREESHILAALPCSARYNLFVFFSTP